MCTQCQQWSVTANHIWGQVYSELEKLQSLVPLLPPPIRTTGTSMLQSIPWEPEQQKAGISELAAHPPSQLTPDGWSRLNSMRAQVLSSGQAWLRSLKQTVEGIEAFRGIQAALAMGGMGPTAPWPILQATHQMQLEWMSATQRMNVQTQRVLQDIEAQNRELWQREIDILSGRPFIDPPWRRW